LNYHQLLEAPTTLLHLYPPGSRHSVSHPTSILLSIIQTFI